MNIIDFNTNFSLLEELEIASKFICKGLDEFDRLIKFEKNEELFHVFYSLSVGIERFQKSLLLLLWEITEENAEEYEKKLITHSLSDLNNEIKNLTQVSFCSEDNAFLCLLERFYKSMRYLRFTVSRYHDLTEKEALDTHLFEFFSIHSLPEDRHNFFFFPDHSRIKRLIGRSVSRICSKYNSEIQKYIKDKNHSLRELCYQPSYSRLFCQGTERDVTSSKLAEKMVLTRFISAVEAILFIANTEQTSGHMNYLKKIEPLDLDVAFVPDYINSLANGDVSNEMMDEISCAYGEIENVTERIKSLYPLYSSCVIFEEDLWDEEEEEWDIT